jgi:hypothetical protein
MYYPGPQQGPQQEKYLNTAQGRAARLRARVKGSRSRTGVSYRLVLPHLTVNAQILWSPWNWSMLLQFYPSLMLGSAHSVFWSSTNFGSPGSSLYRLSTTRRLQNYKKQVSKRQWNTVFTSMKSNNRDNGIMKRIPNRSQTCKKLMKVKCCVCTTLIATHYWHLNEPALQLPDSELRRTQQSN